MFNLSAYSFAAIAPEVALTIGALIVLLLDLVTPKEQRFLLVYFSLAAVGVAAYYASFLWGQPGFYFYDSIVVDNFRISVTYILLIGAALTVLISGPYLRREDADYGEYYALILFATVGMMLMAGAMDLVVVFLGLETLSISVYILSAFQRNRLQSNEAGMKYLLTGSFATAFLLYGIALIYGATGTTNLDGINRAITSNVTQAILANLPPSDLMLFAGVALLLVGFGFKVAAFPFHLWTPDVYEGAPTSVTAFMAAGVKVAAFAAFARVFITSLGPLHPLWAPKIAVLAVLTMTLGNIVAVTQTNIKRLLAYSSIAHAGYLLIGIAAGTGEAASAIVFYLAAYTLMTMGVFAIIIYLGRKGEPNLSLYDFAGLGYRYPLLGAAMVILMMSFAGIPPTAGFMAKFFLFRAAVHANLTWLVVVAVLNSVISVYYYLGVVVRMFMNPPEEEPRIIPLYAPAGIALAASTIGVLALGIIPGFWLDAATQSAMVALGLR
jgi:NADH-quinone oxidoreductase subunit N